MQTDKEKINGTRGICRAIIRQDDDDSPREIINEFSALGVPTDNKQLRYSFENKEYFYQVLRTAKENIVPERLDSGLPLFDNHPEIEDAGAMFQLGITTEYEFLPEGILIRCKLGARADEALRSDIKNQIVKTVSIEGDVHEYTIERVQGQIPVYYATKWEPTSVSFAPVPQDIASQIEVKRAIQKQIEKPETGKSIIQSIINKF